MTQQGDMHAASAFAVTWTCSICTKRNELAELAAPGGIDLFPELRREFCEFVDPRSQPPGLSLGNVDGGPSAAASTTANKISDGKSNEKRFSLLFFVH